MKVRVEYEVDNCRECPYLNGVFTSSNLINFELTGYECIKCAWNSETIPASKPKNCPLNKYTFKFIRRRLNERQ